MASNEPWFGINFPGRSFGLDNRHFKGYNAGHGGSLDVFNVIGPTPGGTKSVAELPRVMCVYLTKPLQGKNDILEFFMQDEHRAWRLLGAVDNTSPSLLINDLVWPHTASRYGAQVAACMKQTPPSRPVSSSSQSKPRLDRSMSVMIRNESTTNIRDIIFNGMQVGRKGLPSDQHELLALGSERLGEFARVLRVALQDVCGRSSDSDALAELLADWKVRVVEYVGWVQERYIDPITEPDLRPERKRLSQLAAQLEREITEVLAQYADPAH